MLDEFTSYIEIVFIVISFPNLASPPAPGKPYLIKAQSSSITIGWHEAACNGGHTVNNFVIQYRQSSSSNYYSYTYIRNIEPARRNYTVVGLQSSTYYSFSIQAVNLLSSSSSYSSSLSATTLPPGWYSSDGQLNHNYSLRDRFNDRHVYKLVSHSQHNHILIDKLLASTSSRYAKRIIIGFYM